MHNTVMPWNECQSFVCFYWFIEKLALLNSVCWGKVTSIATNQNFQTQLWFLWFSKDLLARYHKIVAVVKKRE